MFDNIKTIIAYFRGQVGVSLKQALTALLAVLTAGVNAMDDGAEAEAFAGPPAGTSAARDPEGAVQYLENMVANSSGKRAQAALTIPPWLLPILTTLLQRWLGGGR